MTHLTPRQRKAQGDAAEARFRAWLDRCMLPHIYVEQSPMTLPHGLSDSHGGRIKRPDFLVGIPPIGTLAFDVKAKTIYDHHILIDAAEHAALLHFEQFFSIAVWFICFPPGDPHGCHLFHEPGACAACSGEAGRGGVHRGAAEGDASRG